jgi:hypothetical protein
MDTIEYKQFKKEVYNELINFAKITRISFRIDRDKTNEIMKKDPSVTLERIRDDFAKYPLIRESIIDYKQVVLFLK